MRNEISEKGHERCLVFNRFSSEMTVFVLNRVGGLKASAVSPYQTSLNIQHPPPPPARSLVARPLTGPLERRHCVAIFSQSDLSAEFGFGFCSLKG